MNRIKLSILTLAAALPAASLLAGSAAGPNLISDPGFDNGIAGWDNFSGNPQHENGTLKITNDYQGNGNSYYSGWYCAPVTEGVKYAASIDYFVPATAPERSGAYFGLHYYPTPDCSGGNLTTGGGSQSGGRFPEQRDQWLSFSFESVAPATAKAVRVRATAFKEPQPYNSSIPETHIVWFDNAFFGTAEDENQDPPPQDPPQQDPPAEEPPAEEPPAEEPPADEPPAEEPPVDEPPVDEPPADEPPADEPPADEPPADDEPPYVPPIVIPTDPEPYDPPTDTTDEPAKPGKPQSDTGPKTPEPQPQTSTEPADQPATDPVDEPTQPEANHDVPLPPATGNSLGANDDGNSLITFASIASMLSGVGLFAVAIRKYRGEKASK